jgi:uncharacterized phage infection (PIP) family protein YhgE
MQTTLNTLKAAALIALIAVAAGVFLAVRHADAALSGKNGVLVGLSQTLAGVDQTTAKAGGTLDSINRLCPGVADPAKPCGVLADLNRTMATIRGATGQVEIAARHENAQLTTIDAQEASLAADLHTVLTAGAGTANAASTTLSAATLAIQKGTDAIAAEQPSLDALIKAATTTVANPDVPILIHHAAGITASGDEIAKDAADKLHQYTHPNKKKVTFWGGADAFMMYLHSRVIPPIF